MAKIPQDIIERVRDTADIVDVVSQFVDLKQRGPNYFGLCPFHSEKTPSFSVAPAKQIYYCFGCHQKGDCFTFVKDLDNLTFVESVKFLAQRAGLQLPKSSPLQTEKYHKTKDRKTFKGKIAKKNATSIELAIEGQNKNLTLPLGRLTDEDQKYATDWSPQREIFLRPVSYTHLTLPTIYSV